LGRDEARRGGGGRFAFEGGQQVQDAGEERDHSCVSVGGRRLGDRQVQLPVRSDVRVDQ
jgi:hypothetical protein